MNSLVFAKGTPYTPPSPPDIEDRGDDNSHGQVLVFGENKKDVESILEIPNVLANSIWQGTFTLRGFTEIEELGLYLYSQVLKNPKLLVSLTYIITKENVNRCLESYLGFFEKVPGFASSSDLEKTIGELKGKIGEQTLEEIYPGTSPEESIRSILLRGEVKARVVEALSCVHLEKSKICLFGPIDPLLDRLSDIGEIIRKKFYGNTASPPIHESIVNRMTDFALFGEE